MLRHVFLIISCLSIGLMSQVYSMQFTRCGARRPLLPIYKPYSEYAARFFQAIKDDDKPTILAYLGVSERLVELIKSTDEQNRNFIHHLARYGRASQLKILLANPMLGITFSTEIRHNRIIRRAIGQSILTLLLAPDKDDNTPLHLAILHNHFIVVTTIVTALQCDRSKLHSSCDIPTLEQLCAVTNNGAQRPCDYIAPNLLGAAIANYLTERLAAERTTLSALRTLARNANPLP